MVSEMESVNKIAASNSVNSGNNNSSQQPTSNPQFNNSPIQQEAVHTPQSVGLEFVRQYYTVLNKAPNLLFRFYSEDSTYVHGDLSVAGDNLICKEFVRGTKQIDGKIKSMNFKNAHTKIRQVDTMDTIGNGVVIQVVGELSNNGQPMRRFLQTFVLAPVNPNKYYVRNDIFRYQDNICIQAAPNEYTVASGEIRPTVRKHEIIVENRNLENDSQIDNSQVNSPVAYISEKNESIHKANGTTPVTANFERLSPVLEKVSSTPQQELENETQISSETKVISDEMIKTEDDDIVKDDGDSNHSDEIPKASVSPSSVASNEPKTYAGILGRNSQGVPTKNVTTIDGGGGFQMDHSSHPPISGSGGSGSGSGGPVGTVQKPPFGTGTGSSTGSNPSSTQQQSKRNDFHFQKRTYNRRNDSRSDSAGKNNDSDSGDGDQQQQAHSATYVAPANPKKYPDENQLFIGNLLPSVSEESLHKIFIKYGKIIEIRINRQKMPNKNRNYGFITFENSEVVDTIIAQKPIWHESHRYNVEKKQGRSSAGSNYDRNRERPNNSNSSSGSGQANARINPQSTQSNLSTGNARPGGGHTVASQQSNNPGISRGGGGGGGGGGSSRGGSGGGMGSGANFNHSSNNNSDNSQQIGNKGQNYSNRNNAFNNQQQAHNR